MLTLPYAHLNLRWNPFGELPPEQRAGLAVVDLEPAVEALQAGGCVQFLGECGRGKTTHLLALRARFPDAPMIRLSHDAPTPPIPDAPLLFVDEAQLVPPRKRRRLFRRGSALALGTHEDHSAELRSAGRSALTLEVAIQDPDRLLRLFAARIEHARRGPGPLPTLGPDAVEALVTRCGDDVRGMEAVLYEVFQRMPEVRRVQV